MSYPLPKSVPAPSPRPEDPLGEIRAFHARTKHRLDAYAPGPGAVDWDEQPEPSRRFAGCPTFDLPLPGGNDGPTFASLASGLNRAPAPAERAALGEFLGLSLGISAWKHQRGARWSVRCCPSSGNLHPTEAYLVLPPLPDIAAGLDHYRAEDHALECRAGLTPAVARRLAGLLPSGGFLLGLTSIPWREAWKYGERAWRYCQLDLGHALGALAYSAALLGWTARPLEHWSDPDVGRVLGLNRSADFEADEPEYPELACLVCPSGELAADPPRLPPGLLDAWAG